MYADLGEQVSKIYGDAVEMSYYMRGSITLNDALEMATIEKNITIDWLNKHFEKEFKKLHPIY